MSDICRIQIEVLVDNRNSTEETLAIYEVTFSL